MNMKLLTLAFVLSASTASFAGDTSCGGKIVVGPEWTTMEDEHEIPLPKDHPRYSPPVVCRFKTESPLGKRILGKCPNGVSCVFNLSIANKPKDHRKDGHVWTITQWPQGGVERE
jgi:hypothetical protein